jgi:hypothetical protein
MQVNCLAMVPLVSWFYFSDLGWGWIPDKAQGLKRVVWELGFPNQSMESGRGRSRSISLHCAYCAPPFGVPHLRCSTMMMDANPALPGWADV